MFKIHTQIYFIPISCTNWCIDMLILCGKRRKAISDGACSASSSCTKSTSIHCFHLSLDEVAINVIAQSRCKGINRKNPRRISGARTRNACMTANPPRPLLCKAIFSTKELYITFVRLHVYDFIRQTASLGCKHVYPGKVTKSPVRTDRPSRHLASARCTRGLCDLGVLCSGTSCW